MAASILTLPLEILIDVTSYLQLDDFVGLRDSKQELFDHLKGESASRAFVKVGTLPDQYSLSDKS